MTADERLAQLPPKLQSVVQMLGSAPKVIKTEMLLEFAKKMPPLPEGMQGKLEQVHECTTPFFVHAELQEGKVHLYFDAPKEAPTVRAFAGLLAEGLEGESPEAILGVPEDFYSLARLEEIITPLRLRGLQAVLMRIKRQVREAQ
ncbi:MAG: cysteine desulfuration protein SufE [Meiothermus sp.]|uniref:Cysteine desufuration protein SufE n=2 Tax=Meiothermus hypogaeus TaxID=884155 RepID=A0A511R209_9DEIN|nr:SufE family protein [Meiothermus hypogaeus]RIH77643.1 putative SufE-like protein [Meiothermus hypogaeus]GEM83645.1 cysteine desufuration protein SufE [Meiothermus hypogaeus NBRC 106114]GIW38270.1 MAG: cysteine desulfuration protein SufE [Meiothermus sp.]